MTPPHAPTLAATALQLQALADEYCDLNPYAELVILRNFGGWLASRGVRVASPAAPPPVTEAMVHAATNAILERNERHGACCMDEDEICTNCVEAALRAALEVGAGSPQTPEPR